MTEHTDTRINRMAERLAVVESKTETLERTLPRIGKLEAGVAALGTRIEGVGQDIHSIQQDGHRSVEALQRLQEQHLGLSEKISRLFWTGAGATLVIGVVISMVSFAASISNIDGWIDRAQDRKAEHRARRQGGITE